MGDGVFGVVEALEEAEVDQDVDEGVEIGDGSAVADVRALDAESNGLGVDAFDSRALVEDMLVGVAAAVEGVT